MPPEQLLEDFEKACSSLPPLDATLAATLNKRIALVISALFVSKTFFWIKDYDLSVSFEEMAYLSAKSSAATFYQGSNIRGNDGRATEIDQIILGGMRTRRISKWECYVYQRQSHMCNGCITGWRNMLRQMLFQFCEWKHSCLVVVEKMHGKHFALMNSGTGLDAHVFEPNKETRMPVSIGMMSCDFDCLPVLIIASELRWLIEKDMECKAKEAHVDEEKESDIVRSTQLNLHTVVSPSAFCSHVAG